MLGTKEHYDVMAQFEQQFKHRRLDREKDKALWKIGQVYQDGQVNDLFGVFLRGYQLGKQVEHLNGL